MPKTVEIELYEYTELTGWAKENARSLLSQIAYDSFEYDAELDYICTLAEERGISIERKTLECSDIGGRGASIAFKSTIDPVVFMKKNAGGELIAKFLSVYAAAVAGEVRMYTERLHNGRSPTMRFEVDFDNEDLPAPMRAIFYDDALDVFNVLYRSYVDNLNKEYESVDEEENLISIAEANGYLFTKEGKPFQV